jgi:putative tryptophan/tyrosine transport system substrate-binding protein
MLRRQFIGVIGGAAAWPLAALAQQTAGRVWRIGFLGSTAPTPAMVSALRDGLRERGYLEGQNLSIDVRWLLDQDPHVATELVRSGVDLIVAWATPAAVAAHRATATIPIVLVSVADPVGSGVVAELARPGGNVTGMSNMSPELSGKLVQLLIEIVPGMKRVGVVRNPNDLLANANGLRQTAEAIRALGLQIEVVDAETAEEFESAFARLSGQGVGGVVLLPDAALVKHRVRIAELALKARLPTVFQRRENAEAGGLLSYGSNLSDLLRQAAVFVDRILKGARPAELPVEQPTKFILAINLKTAKALSLELPPTLLARADEVIE